MRNGKTDLRGQVTGSGSSGPIKVLLACETLFETDQGVTPGWKGSSKRQGCRCAGFIARQERVVCPTLKGCRLRG